MPKEAPMLRLSSGRRMAVLLLCLTTVGWAPRPPPQQPLPLPKPSVQAVVNYAGLDVDDYVFPKVARIIQPYHPRLAHVLRIPLSDQWRHPKEIGTVLARILPRLKGQHGAALQATLLAVDHQAGWLATTASGRRLMQHYGLHVRPYDGGWLYDHDDLWRAWKLDPESSLGKDAFLLLLESGFDPSNDCQFGSDNFLRVIRYGEPWLHAHPKDPRILFVRFILAQAYHTWWVLGHTGNPADQRYVRGSQKAYAHAVNNYHYVLQTLNHLPRARYGRPHYGGGNMEYAAQTELQRLENKQIDFSAFYCVRHN